MWKKILSIGYDLFYGFSAICDLIRGKIIVFIECQD